MNRSSVALFLIVLAGCRLTEAPDLSKPDVEILAVLPGDEPGSADVTRSRPVMLIADNQFRYMGGSGLFETTAFANSFFGAANRPMPVHLLSEEVFAWVLAQNGNRPIIHLGDACDISCRDEYLLFVHRMKEAGAPWVMAPGNHDGFFLGNSDQEWRFQVENWKGACAGGGAPMTKGDLVALYLASQFDLASGTAAGDSLAEAFGWDAADLTAGLEPDHLYSTRLLALAERIRSRRTTGSWTHHAGAGAFLTGLSWSIDERSPQRSYVVQRVSLDDPSLEGTGASGFTGVLLDSAQYYRRPAFIPVNVAPPWQWNAGLRGELLPDQLRVVAGWMDEAEAQGDSVVLFVHHPFRGLTSKSRSAIEWLFLKRPVALMVSAHTHRGGTFLHQNDGFEWLEVNVASITDWPMEWRELSLSRYQREGRPYVGVHVPRHLLLDELIARGWNLSDAWDDLEEGAERFLAYQNVEGRALDYTATINDVFGSQWPQVAFVGLFTWMLLGEDSVMSAIQERVLPNIEGVQEEHEANMLVMLTEYRRLIQKFPTVGHRVEEWESIEASLLEAIDEATRSRPGGDALRDLIDEVSRYEVERAVKEPTAYSQYKILLVMWASLFEAERHRHPQITDQSFRISPARWTGNALGR
jgi:hypothetical protein